MESNNSADREALAGALAALGAVASAAECHGIASGMLTADPAAGPGPWLAHLLGDEFAVEAGDEAHLALLHAAWQRLSDELADTETMGFRPLLPEADSDPAVRAQALVDWVEGFLFGTTLAGRAGDGTDEFLRDLGAIARLDVAAVAGDDVDQRALDELVEYARVGALLVREQALARRLGDEDGGERGAT